MAEPLTDAEITKLRAFAASIDMLVNPDDKVPVLKLNGRTAFNSPFQCMHAPKGHVYTADDIAVRGWPSSMIGEPSPGPANICIDTADLRTIYLECGAQTPGQDITAIEVFLSVLNPLFTNRGIKCTVQGGKENIAFDGNTAAPPPPSPVEPTQITSADGRFLAVQQGDGNFVVYKTSTMTPLWDSVSWTATHPGQ